MTFSIIFYINDNKVIGQWSDASVKEPFLYIGFTFGIQKSEVVFAKNFAPSFKKQPDRFSKPAAITGKQKLDSKNHFDLPNLRYIYLSFFKMLVTRLE